MRITFELYKGNWRMLLDQRVVAKLVNRNALAALEDFLASIDCKPCKIDSASQGH